MTERKPLTEEELSVYRQANEQRKALKAQASPAEWEVDEDTVVAFFNDDRHVIAGDILTPEDASLIEHARNDGVEEEIDALLEEIAWLKALLHQQSASGAKPPGTTAFNI